LCSFTSTTNLKVTFGSSATVEPDDEIIIKDYALQTSSSSASLFTMNETFIVGQPLSATIPSVTLSASSTSVGVCDDLMLDGSSSTGSGGRSMAYNFSVTPGNSGLPVANVSEVLNDMNALNGGNGKYRVIVPSSDMVKGSDMVFTLSSTNFLNKKGAASITVTKLGIPAPTISIQGSNPRSTTRSASLKLTATAELPTMTCLNYDLSSAKMSFLWYEETGQFTGDLTDTSKNPRILSIPADSLVALNTYVFRVVGFMTDTPNVNNSATITVEVAQQSLIAIISGGTYMQYGVDTSFELDGSSSYDPDDTSELFSYFWVCAASSSAASCDGLTTATDSSILSVPTLSLPVGDYLFTLIVSKGSRNDTAEVDIEIVAGAPPVISITALTQDKYNTDEEFLSLVSTVTSSFTYTTVWSADSSDVSDLFVSGGSYVSTVSNKLTAVLGLMILTEGDTYTLRLTATDSYGASSYSTVSLTMNEPPSSGSIDVSPNNGYALDTSFTFTATNWVDNDLPLTYIFGTTGVNDDGSLDTTSLSPFGDERSDASYLGVTLSTGLNITNYTIGCFSEVVDSYGAVGSATTSVRVRSRPLTVGELKNISETKASAAIESSDADASKQILSATTDGLSSTTDSSTATTRRALLGSGSSDAAALRASVLSNLWSTYEITPITVSDVASLLSVLVGVVDTPSEVTYDVASGAHFFLQTILRASLGADIGISTSSTTYVGETLTYLLSTRWFNSSETRAFVNGKNATNVIDLVSAAQLYGAYDGVGYALNTGDIDMFSYRTEASTLLTDMTVSLSGGGSSNDKTAAYFNANVSDLITASGESSIMSTDLLDFKVVTLGSNIYASAITGSAGTPEATASRLDQTGDALTGQILFRSDLTLVEVSMQDSTEPMEIRSLPAGAFQVTLAATVAFNTSFSDFGRTFACGGSSNGLVIDLNCPLTSESHTCDLATHGEGGAYFFDYTCPYVEPTCLYWDESTLDFEGDDCTLVSGYSTDTVACECTRTGTFILGANITQPTLEVFTTPSPTQVPTSVPTPQPTHIPTPVPTDSPTMKPTPEPTFVPTSFPTPRPTSLPTYLPTLEPTSLPTVEPTFSPTWKPTTKPSPLPTLNPSFAPTLFPTLEPTSLPTSKPSNLPTTLPTPEPTWTPTPSPTLLPTSLPTNKPSLSPTLNPTTPSTASVAVQFDVTANGPPTSADKAALQTSISNATGVSENNVKNLEVSYTVSRRRALTPEQSRDHHRRLSTYTWTVNFDVQTDLATIDSTSSSDFAANVNTQLSDPSFSATLINKLPTTVTTVSALTTIASTRRPTSLPVPSPTQLPIPQPTLSPNVMTLENDDSMNDNTNAGGSMVLLIVLLTVIPFVVLVGGFVYFKFKKSKQSPKVAPITTTVNVSPTKPHSKTKVVPFTSPNDIPATENEVSKMIGGQSAEV